MPTPGIANTNNLDENLHLVSGQVFIQIVVPNELFPLNCPAIKDRAATKYSSNINIAGKGILEPMLCNKQSIIYKKLGEDFAIRS
jgi:hypothetical protein